MEAVFTLQPSDSVEPSGDERDVEVGRETKGEYRLTEEGELAKYITSRFKKENPEEDSYIGGVARFNTRTEPIKVTGNGPTRQICFQLHCMVTQKTHCVVLF